MWLFFSSYRDTNNKGLKKIRGKKKSKKSCYRACPAKSGFNWKYKLINIDNINLNKCM
jgi:hypothetical protein